VAIPVPQRRLFSNSLSLYTRALENALQATRDFQLKVLALYKNRYKYS